MVLHVTTGDKVQATRSRPGWRNIAAKLQGAGWPAAQAVQAGHALAAGLSAYQTEVRGRLLRVEDLT